MSSHPYCPDCGHSVLIHQASGCLWGDPACKCKLSDSWITGWSEGYGQGYQDGQESL